MRRIFAKTMTYGFMHLAITFCVSWAVSRDLRVALAISFLEPAVQIVFFAIHEYLWNRKNPGVPSLHQNCCATRAAGVKVFDFISKKYK